MGIALKLVLSSLSMTDSIGRHALLQNAEDDSDLAGADPAVTIFYLLFFLILVFTTYSTIGKLNIMLVLLLFLSILNLI